RESGDSTRQCTALPRLAAAASSVVGDRRPPCRTLSDDRRSMTLVSRGAVLALTAPFGFAARAAVAAGFFPALRVALTPALPDAFTAVTAPRPRSLAALPDAFRIFAAPADLPAGSRRIQDLPDFFHEILRKARLGDEGVAAGLFGPLRDAGERVTGQRDDRNRRGALVRLEAARRLPPVHHRQ